MVNWIGAPTKWPIIYRSKGLARDLGRSLHRSLRRYVHRDAGNYESGAAYVPMDPAYPAERLAFMMQDAAMPVVLTQAHLLDKLATDKHACICLDRDWEKIAVESEEAPQVAFQPDQLAYVIYTSGSTGTPKGVMVEHRSLLNLISWHQRTYEVTAATRATQIAGTAFDASVWETWPYLTKGSTYICRKKRYGWTRKATGLAGCFRD